MKSEEASRKNPNPILKYVRLNPEPMKEPKTARGSVNIPRDAVLETFRAPLRYLRSDAEKALAITMERLDGMNCCGGRPVRDAAGMKIKPPPAPTMAPTTDAANANKATMNDANTGSKFKHLCDGIYSFSPKLISNFIICMPMSKQPEKLRNERVKIYRYKVTILEEPPQTLDGFKIFGIEVKLGKGRHVDFPPDKRELDVETTQEPLPMDVEVNAKYQRVDNRATIVRRRSLMFKIERVADAVSPRL